MIKVIKIIRIIKTIENNCQSCSGHQADYTCSGAGLGGCLTPTAGQAELAWLAVVGTWDRANKEIRTHSVTLVGKARF